MINDFTYSRSHLILSIIFTVGITSASFGQGMKTKPTNAQRQIMAERHKKLAEMHTKMAACLESDKAPTLCRQEMIDSCSTDFGGNCPIMRAGKQAGRGRGMMKGAYMDWMISPEADTTAAPKKAQPTK